MSNKINEFRVGIKPLMGAMIGAGCGLSSISFYTHSVFVSSISSDTGWSRGDVQLGVSIMILLAIITAPLIGTMVDRYGARIIGLISIPLYGFSMACFFFVEDQLWSYYLIWVLMSIIAAGTLPVTWTRVVNGWFDRYRGIALGITLAGTGIAATLGPVYVSWLIDAYGWRLAYALLAGTITIISFPSVYFLFKEREQKELNENSNGKLFNTHEVGLVFSEAIKSYHFWAIGFALVLAAAGISGLITNSVPMLIDKGITRTNAAEYAGLIGLSVIIGRLIVGFLLDYFWAPLIAAIFLAAPLISAYILGSHIESNFYISISMIIIGLAAGAELDLLAFLVSRYFGLLDYGKLYGSLYIFFSIGAGFAPVTFGKTFDAFGDYSLVLNIVAVMSICSAILMLTLGSYPKFKSK
jgi:MFS family permease